LSLGAKFLCQISDQILRIAIAVLKFSTPEKPAAQRRDALEAELSGPGTDRCGRAHAGEL